MAQRLSRRHDGAGNRHSVAVYRIAQRRDLHGHRARDVIRERRDEQSAEHQRDAHRLRDRADDSLEPEHSFILGGSRREQSRVTGGGGLEHR